LEAVLGGWGWRERARVEERGGRRGEGEEGREKRGGRRGEGEEGRGVRAQEGSDKCKGAPRTEGHKEEQQRGTEAGNEKGERLGLRIEGERGGEEEEAGSATRMFRV
jgi:hypothetical protein